MKTFLLRKIALLIIAMTAALSADARTFNYTYKGQTLTYYVDDSNSTECNVDSYNNISGYVEIPETAIDSSGKSYSVTSIGSWAFFACKSLTSVTIPNSVTEIGKVAFCDCKGLTSVTIPNSVTKIGDNAFEYCYGIKHLTFEDGYKPLTLGYNYYSYNGRYYYSGLFSEGAIETLYLGRDLSYDSKYPPFKDQRTIKSITIGNSVTSISGSAFEGCSGLTSVTIPNSVTSIGRSAFKGCSGLTSVTIGNSVTSIGDYAFGGNEIASIEVLANEPPVISDNSFSSYTFNNSLITVPYGTKASYSVQWDKFKYIIDNPLKKSFDISTPGDLVNQVSIDEINDIVELKLSGKINGTDLLTMNKLVCLTSVDLSQATIVEGGMPYYEKDNKRFGTQNNTLGQNWAYNLKFLNNVKLPENLTGIGRMAFSGLYLIKELEIPGSVTSIDEYAFSGCRRLTDITIEDSKNDLYLTRGVFSDCPIKGLYLGRNLSSDIYSPFMRKTTLETITLGNSVTAIGDFTFDGCSGLTYVIIGNSVTSIGRFAFYGCSGVTSVIIPNSVTSIGESAFESCAGLTSVIIPNSVTSIGESAFESCAGLTSVSIPNSVTSIGESAFENCSGLTSVTIPNSVTSIESSAFMGCSGLTSVTIPNSVTSIGRFAFYGCSGVTSVIIPNSVTSIGESAFESCAGLTSVSIPNSVTSIGESAFEGCSGLTSVTIPNSVTTIEGSAFMGCSGLTSVTIPNSVTSIGRETFDGCTGLTSVTIPNTVTEIGRSAFNGCSSLTEINIPGSVREIGANAFAECGLTEITMINPIPAVIESNTFSVYEGATLNVPDGSRNIYWIHPYWGQFKNIKVSGSESVEDFVADEVTYHITSELLATVEVSAANLSAHSRSAGGKLAIPESVTYNDKEYTVAGIANNGFENAGLTEITLPATINYVGLNAFKGCNGLTSITCSAVLPPSVDLSSFDEEVYNKATLNVLETSLEGYENNAVWKKFKMGALSGIESVTNDADDEVQVVDGCIIAPEGCEVFDLYGHSVNPENLSRGIYIVRMKNGETVKVKI